MTGEVWLGQLERAVRGRVDDVEISRPDRETMTFGLGMKDVAVHLSRDGKVVVLPSIAARDSLSGMRMEDDVEDLPFATYDLEGSTVLAAADLIAEHLTGETPADGPRTLRDGYGTLGTLNGEKNQEQGQRRERFLALRYEGVPFGEHEIRYRNDDPTEINYSKEMAEAISFGHLVVGTGLDHLVSDIENRTPPEPDLRVTLTDGSHVWVEVGQVTEPASAKYFSAIQKVNQHLRRLENADPAYLSEIQGRHVSVQLPNAPTAAESRLAADEIVKLLRSIDFDTVQRKALIGADPAVAPYLASLGANYYVGDGISTYVRANNVGNSFDPEDSVSQFVVMLQSKMAKKYAVDAPLWLALPLTDLMQVPTLSLRAIRRRILADTGQFDRVLVGIMEDAEVIDKPDA